MQQLLEYIFSKCEVRPGRGGNMTITVIVRPDDLVHDGPETAHRRESFAHVGEERHCPGGLAVLAVSFGVVAWDGEVGGRFYLASLKVQRPEPTSVS